MLRIGGREQGAEAVVGRLLGGNSRPIGLGAALIALPGMIPFEGGVPLVYRGEVDGAIGVSGGPP
jgi:hypothetical protein